MTGPQLTSYSVVKTSMVKRSGTRQRYPLSPLSFNVVLEVLARTIRQEKRDTNHSNWERRVKLSLFANDMILYVETSKDFTKKQVKLINEFSKFCENTKLMYKIYCISTN